MESQGTNSALRQLQEQIEAVRNEAYRNGYADAMAAILNFVQTTSLPSTTLAALCPEHYAEAKLNGKGSFEEVRPRGTNRKLVLGLLQPIAPRAIGPTTLVRLIKRQSGVDISYSSVRNALRQMESAGIVQEVDDTKTWRFIGSTSGNLLSEEGVA